MVAFKVICLATQEQQEKWNRMSIRNLYEIYPQLSIFFSEIMSKYTKLFRNKRWVYTVRFTLSS